jgi:arabinoxylan arabinofuranohydrolase
MSLQNITSITYRVASAGPGGRIEVHVGSPGGTRISTSPLITSTGGTETYSEVTAPVSAIKGTRNLVSSS